MKNTIKRTTALTTAIAAVVAVGNNVHADEVTTPVVPATEPVAETTVATPTTTVSDEQVLDAQSKVTDAKVAVETKQAAASNAQAERDAKSEELNTAKEEVKAVSEKVEAAKEITPEKIAELEKTADEKSAEKEVKTQALETARNTQTEKQATVTEKSNALDQAKASQKDAKNKVKEAEDALSGTAVKNAQDAKDAADQKVVETTANKASAEKELEDSKKADAERDAKKAQITSEIPAKETTASEAGEAVKSAEKALDAIPTFTNVSVNADWAKAAKDYLNTVDEDWRAGLQRGTEAYDQAEQAHDARVDAAATVLNNVSDNARREASRQINSVSQQGDVELYEINNLPDNVLNEVNDQFITTLNEIRRALGLGNAKINAKNIEFAKEVAKRYVANKIAFADHSGKSIAEAAKALGYKYNTKALTTETNIQSYENLATYWGEDIVSRDGKLQLSRFDLKKLAAESAISFMMEGAGGHFTSLVRDDIQGAAYSVTTDSDGQLMLQLHVLNANSFGQNQITDVETTNRALPETDRATAQVKLDQAKANKVTADKAVVDAKAELARLNAEVSTTPAKQVAVANATEAYNNAIATQTEANRKLDAVKASESDKLATLEQARAQKAQADTVVAEKTSDLEAANTALTLANAEVAKAEEAFRVATYAEADARKAVVDAKLLLADKVRLESELQEKTAIVDALTKALAALESNLSTKVNELQSAERTLEDATKEYNRLLAIYTAERKVAPLVQEENPEFEGGVNYAEDLVFELPELVIPEEPTTVPVVDAIIAQVTDNTPSLREVVASGSEVKTTSDVVVDKLPETGAESTIMQTVLGTIFMMTGVGVVSKRKKD